MPRRHSRPCTRRRRRDGRLRIESKPLLDYLMVIAVEESARQDVPIQFHTGLGDPDLDLTPGGPGRAPPAVLGALPGGADRAAPHAATRTSGRWPTSPRCSRTSTPTWARRPVRGRRGDRDLPRAARARTGQQDPVQHGRVARPGALLGRRAARPASARPGPRRAHRRRARSTSGSRSRWPSGSCGATPSAVYGL